MAKRNGLFGAVSRFINEAVPAWVSRMQPARGFRTYPVGSALVGLTTPEDALKIATVYRCVNLISSAIAMLPWQVFKKDRNGQGERQPHNPVEWLLNHKASDEVTAFNFKRTIKAHSLLYGNGYAEIQRDQANRPYALHLLDPGRVTPGRDENGRVAYKVRNSNSDDVILAASDVLHVAGLGFDGLRGYSVLEYAAPTVTTSLALQKSLQKFFQDGFRPMGFFKTKGRLSVEGLKALEDRIEQYSGLSNRWKAIPLDQDMEFDPLATTPEDGSVVDLSKLNTLDICRLFDVPPHLAFDLDRATFSNIESLGREFLTFGMMHHLVGLEQEADWKLLSNNHGGLYSKININAIVRADISARFAAYKIALDSGLNNINEIRALEDQPSIGPEGDVYVRQVQYQPIGTELQPQTVKDPAAPLAKPDPNAPPAKK